jgi:hypothetical protein
VRYNPDLLLAEEGFESRRLAFSFTSPQKGGAFTVSMKSPRNKEGDYE